MNKRIYILFLSAFVVPGLLMSQNDNNLEAGDILPSRTLVIESQYSPTLLDGVKPHISMTEEDRPYTLHSVEYTTTSESYREYKGAPINSIVRESNSSATPFDATALLSYGVRNRLEGLLNLNYRAWQDGVFNLNGNILGWANRREDRWCSYMFDSNAKLSYSHRLVNHSILFETDYGFRNHNFRQGRYFLNSAIGRNFLAQNISSASLYGSIHSSDTLRYNYGLKLGYEYLSSNKLLISDTPLEYNEKLIRMELKLGYALANGRVGIDYRNKVNLSAKYATFTLSPSWRLDYDEGELVIGGNVDFRTGRRDIILASPHMEASYRLKRGVILKASLLGGLLENNARRIYSLSPYWRADNAVVDGYKLIDASAGIELLASNSVDIYLRGGYSYTKDELFQTMSDSLIVSSHFQQHNSGLLYTQLLLNAELQNQLFISMDLRFQHWTNNRLGRALELKPWALFNIKGGVKVVDNVTATVEYDYRRYHKVEAAHYVNNLSIGVNYKPYERWLFGLNLNNLFNHTNYYYAGYMSEKINLMATAVYNF